MKNSTDLFRCPFAHAFRFKGGGSPKPPQAIAPPVTRSAVEINQEKRDTARQNQAKKGYAATVLAGETQGYGSSPTEKKTVLGG